jgi:hypothetical protein
MMMDPFHPLLMTMEYCKSCDVCQEFVNKVIVQPPLHSISTLGAFENWGIDLIQLFPNTSQNNIFLT